MHITTETIARRKVIFDSILEDIPGGVGLDKSRLTTGLEQVAAGTLVNVTNRVAEVVKTAICVANSADATHIRVAKNHLFKVGESLTDGFAVAAISSIDTTTSTAYDILTLGASLVSYAANAVLIEVNTGAAMGVYASATVTIATGKTITVNDQSGRAAGVIVSISAAGDDNLAVGFSGNTLSIALAGTTGTKNTPAVEIQAAIRALGNTLGIDFGAWTCTGDELAGSAITPASGTMALNQPYKYLPTGIVRETVNVEYDNPDVAVVLKGAVRQSALPYAVNAAIKALLPNFTFNA